MKNPSKWLVIGVVVAVLLGCVMAFWLTQSGETRPISPHASSAPNETITSSASPTTTTDFFGHTLEPLPTMTATDKDGRATPPPGNDRRYVNNKVLTCTLNNGDTLYVGIDLGAQAFQDALYLNLNSSYAERASVGYYVYSTPYDATPQYGEWQTTSTAFGGDQHNFIVQNTLDQLKPATYTDSENYGVMWMDERMGGDKTMVGDADIYIRAVSLGKGKLLGSCKATVKYDAAQDIYQLDSLTNLDVRETGYLTETERQELLDWTYTYVAAGLLPKDGGASVYLSTSAKDEVLAASTVEYTRDRTYYPNARVCGYTGRYIQNNAFTSSNSNLVAVSLDCGAMGFITVYFSPDAEGLESLYGDTETMLLNVPEDTMQEIKDALSSLSFEPLTSKRLIYAGADLFMAMERADSYNIQQVFDH